MSRPGNCCACGIDPAAWWMQSNERVWCERCLGVALSLFALVMSGQARIDTEDDHQQTEIARVVEKIRSEKQTREQAFEAKYGRLTA